MMNETSMTRFVTREHVLKSFMRVPSDQ